MICGNIWRILRIMSDHCLCRPDPSKCFWERSNPEFQAFERNIKLYCYHCVAKKLRYYLQKFHLKIIILFSSVTSGETAFRNMTIWVIYAKNPLCRRLHLLNPGIPVKVFYSEGSYVPSIPEDELRNLLNPKCVLAVHVG